MTPPARNHDIYMVQALRAVACVMVVVYHTLQAACGEAAIDAWPNGSAGVDLFFVISGFVMLTASRGHPQAWRLFVARRARRIVPLYWLLTVAKYALGVLRPGLAPHTAAGLWSLAASLLFIPARDLAGRVRPVLGVGWSLNFEAFFYALFAIALAARVHPLWLTPVLLGAAIVGFWHDPAWPAPLFLANGMALEFAAGMALAAAAGVVTRRAAPWLLAVGIGLLLLLPAAGPWRFLTWGVPAVTALAGALALEPVARPRLPRWLLAIGDASYAIYLVHPFAIAALAHAGPAGAGIAVPASVAAGLLVHRHIDLPLQHRLAGRTGRRPQPATAVLSG